MSAVLKETSRATVRDRGTRRSWSRAEKLRIAEEAFRPGASVADVARLHGLNANQLFNWRRTVLAQASPPVAVASLLTVVPSDHKAASAAGFVSVGVTVQADDEEASRMSPASSSVTAGASPDRASPARAAMDDRSGIIVIDLADGTRLRVDAFVNERALRRVLLVLRATA